MTTRPISEKAQDRRSKSPRLPPYVHLLRPWPRLVQPRSTCNRGDSAEFLGQPDEQSFRSAEVAEPIRVLVLDHFEAFKLCAVLAEPDERIVDVVHGKHDAEVAQSVHWGVPVIGDHRRREKSRELEPTVAVWRAHHGDLNALVAQSRDAPCPHAFYHGSPFELEAELSEKRDSGIEGFHHDADVVHSFQRHVSILYYVVRPVNELRPGGRACAFTRIASFSSSTGDASRMEVNMQ